MASALFGNVMVWSELADASGPITSLATTATDGMHVIRLENLGTIPYDVDVSVILPQGSSRLAFLLAAADDAWTAEALSLAGSDTERLECALECRARTAALDRIHCDAVRWRKPQHHRWHNAAAGLPLSLAVPIV